jgi:hypothetical protein
MMVKKGGRGLRRLLAPLERRICSDRDARIEALEARLDHERLFPAEWANRRVRDRFGDRVQAGPFRGLEYPDWGITHVDLYAPKVLGSYELELHDAVETGIASEPSRVLNIGAAEGHYAVGLAMRVRTTHVVAFEAQTGQHALLAEIAERRTASRQGRSSCAIAMEANATCLTLGQSPN